MNITVNFTKHNMLLTTHKEVCIPSAENWLEKRNLQEPGNKSKMNSMMGFTMVAVFGSLIVAVNGNGMLIYKKSYSCLRATMVSLLTPSSSQKPEWGWDSQGRRKCT